MYEDDVTDGYTANLHFGNSFFNQFNSPEVDILSGLTPRSSNFNSTNDESSVSYFFAVKDPVRNGPDVADLVPDRGWQPSEKGNLSSLDYRR